MAVYGDPPAPNTTYYYNASNTTNATNANNHTYYNSYDGTYYAVQQQPGQSYTTFAPNFSYNTYIHEWSNEEDAVVPILADATTTKAALQKQLDVLESLEDGVEGKMGEDLSDAIYFLRESMDALERLTK